MDLDALIRRFQKKDIIAFEKLYEKYWENICGVVFTIVRDKSLAEDITQDVFAKAWNNSDDFNPTKGRFFTYLLNMARSAASRKQSTSSNLNQKKTLPTDFFLEILEKEDARRKEIDVPGLKKLLNSLSPKSVQIISLLYFNRYTEKEVAEKLNLPQGTVKTGTKNCISQLRENLTLEWM